MDRKAPDPVAAAAGSPRATAVLAGLLGLAFLIYLPGAGGPYVADDIPNLENNPHLVLEHLTPAELRAAAASSPSSPFLRPLSMLSFALNYTLAGDMAPWSAKLFNILLHLATGVFVYLLTRRLLRHAAGCGPRGETVIALVATGAWLLHPLFVSTVLYTVQRMAVLSALCMFAGCFWYIRARERAAADGRGVAKLVAGSALFTLLAFLCKENGALLPGLLLLVEWFCFGFRFPAGAGAGPRAALAAALAAPAVAVAAWLLFTAASRWHEPAPSYAFTVGERALSQFRVLWLYAGWLTFSGTEPMGLYHDDFRASSGLLQPPATLAGMLFWMAAAGGGVVLAMRRHVAGFGLLWFLWGHALESTVLPLSLIFEHRNYLPGYGLLLGVIAGVHGGLRRLPLSPPLRRAVTAILLLVLAPLPPWQLHQRARAWSDERALVLHSLERQPDSALTLLMAATFLGSRGDYPGALSALHRAQRADPDEVSLLLAEAALHCQFRPGDAFDGELAGKLARAGRTGPRTVTARKQYSEMVKACAGDTANDGPLLDLYMALRRHPRGDVAVMSLYGIGAVHLHRGEYAAAVRAWEEAVSRYPQGAALRPMLESLEQRRRSFPEPDAASGDR